MLGSFNNFNTIKFSHKAMTSKDFKEIHQVVIDDISNNMAALVQSGKYGTTNTTYSTKNGLICD